MIHPPATRQTPVQACSRPLTNIHPGPAGILLGSDPLLSGSPNSSTPSTADLPSHPYGYCPSAYWRSTVLYSAIYIPGPHSKCDPTRHTNGNSNYSSMDYALDQADFVTSPTNGQGASIYAIGLGNRVGTFNQRRSRPGRGIHGIRGRILRRLECQPWRYYYSSSTGVLNTIFLDIYNNITTRIAQ